MPLHDLFDFPHKGAPHDESASRSWRPSICWPSPGAHRSTWSQVPAHSRTCCGSVNHVPREVNRTMDEHVAADLHEKAGPTCATTADNE